MKFYHKILLAWPAAFLIPTCTAWFLWPEHMFKFRIAYDAATYYHMNMPHTLLNAFLVAFLVMVIPFAHKREKTLHGSAKKADRGIVKKMELDSELHEGIVLGEFQRKFLVMAKSLSIMMFAPPGTGKTSCVIIPTLLFLRNSVIVTDFKGELYRITAAVRSRFSKIVYFNPADRRSKRFNPFDGDLLPEDLLDLKSYITNVAGILIKDDKNGKSYFSNAARDSFVFVAYWLIWKNGSTSIPQVREKLVESPDVADTLRDMIEDLEEEQCAFMNHPQYEEEKDYIVKSLIQDGNAVLVPAEATDQWTGVLGTLTNALNPFSDPRIEQATSGKSDIIPSQLRDEITSIYIVIKDKDRKRLAPIISLMYEMIATELISEETTDEDNNVTFILDEFIRLGKVEYLVELPDISRSYGVNCIYAAQDSAQVRKHYSAEELETLMSSCNYRVIFQQNNLKTAKETADTIGTFTNTKVSVSKSNKKVLQTDVSKSESEEAIQLITAQDILNLNQNKVIIMAKGFMKHPITANKTPYFKNKQMQKLIKENKGRIDLIQ